MQSADVDERDDEQQQWEQCVLGAAVADSSGPEAQHPRKSVIHDPVVSAPAILVLDPAAGDVHLDPASSEVAAAPGEGKSPCLQAVSPRAVEAGSNPSTDAHTGVVAHGGSTSRLSCVFAADISRCRGRP